MKRQLILAALVLLVPAAGFGYVEIQAECDAAQEQFLFQVFVFNQMLEGDVTGWEVVFEETWTGSCETPVLVHAVPLPEPYGGAEYSFSVPVKATEQYFFYRAKLRSPAGELQDINLVHPSPVAAVSCGPAIAVRGYLVATDYLGFYDVLPCPGDCGTWLCPTQVDLSQVPEEQWLPYADNEIPVDVYGLYGWVNPMLGSPCLYVEEVRPTPGGICEPVATDHDTWDAIKARFR